MTVDTVVFDIGNVLLAWDPRNLYRRLFDDRARMEWFLAEVCSPAWNLEQDRGRPWAEAIAEATARHPDYAREIRAYRDQWADMIAGEIPGSVAVLNQLKAKGVPLYSITNFAADTLAEAKAIFPFLATSFIDIVVSADEGLLKPDPRIYCTLLERNGLAPEQTVFIDDSAANVAAARALGMAGIHFTSGTDLAAELQAIGIPARCDATAG